MGNGVIHINLGFTLLCDISDDQFLFSLYFHMVFNSLSLFICDDQSHFFNVFIWFSIVYHYLSECQILN
jgi:hypothetical protein